MPVGAQPPRRRGTVERPYSALNLRLVLASFALLSCLVLGIVLLALGYRLPGVLLLLLGLPAIIDIVVIQLRRRARRREDHQRHSMFE